jgi:hypothetical protein
MEFVKEQHNLFVHRPIKLMMGYAFLLGIYVLCASYPEFVSWESVGTLEVTTLFVFGLLFPGYCLVKLSLNFFHEIRESQCKKDKHNLCLLLAILFSYLAIYGIGARLSTCLDTQVQAADSFLFDLRKSDKSI